MHQLAILFRAAQFYAHLAHNLVTGPSLFSDHAHLGELYQTYEGAFDTVVEREIGLGLVPDIISYNVKAAAMLEPTRSDSSAKDFFERLLLTEKDILIQIKKALGQTPSDGTANLLQGLADQSEARIYKLKQRLA